MSERFVVVDDEPLSLREVLALLTSLLLGFLTFFCGPFASMWAFGIISSQELLQELLVAAAIFALVAALVLVAGLVSLLTFCLLSWWLS